MSAASPWLALFRKQRASEAARTQKRSLTKSKGISTLAQNRQPMNQINNTADTRRENMMDSELIERLLQTEKDAARYHWLIQNAKLGIGRNGKDWDLQIDGPAPDSISEVSEWIDEAMNTYS